MSAYRISALQNAPQRNWRIPRRFFDAATDDFPEQREAIGNLADMASYFITGPVGSGKTHLACGILRGWTDIRHAPRLEGYQVYFEYDEISARFITVPELLGTVKSSFDGQGKSTEWIIKSYQNARCLVLDDLGAEQKTEWSFSCLYRIISHRDSEMLPTIITSNLALAQLEEWEPRIASRLAGMRVITLAGNDMRLGKGVT